MRFALGLLLVVALLAACQTAKPVGNTSQECIDGYVSIDGTCVPLEEPVKNGTQEETVSPETPVETVPSEPETPVEANGSEGFNVKKTVTAFEGELVALKPKAVDPEGSKITYSFSKPFNSQGEWQTKSGDAGNYFVTITASDGELSSSVDVLVKIVSKNMPPTLNCPEIVRVDEGQLLNLGCEAKDPEGDDLTVTYSGWMTAAKKQTGFDDAGEYKVTVSAKEEAHEAVTKTVAVIVKNINRAPVIEKIDDVILVEGKTVKVSARASDPDGDKMNITYSSPLDANGEWKTVKGDAGKSTVTVSVTDGIATSKETFVITVTSANSAPVITGIDDIIVTEGDLVKLMPKVTDTDGDNVSVMYSGWMIAAEKQTGYDDAGSYKVTVTASDGSLKTEKTITVTVNDKNRPPEFVIPA
jgi:hypothetical protein